MAREKKGTEKSQTGKTIRWIAGNFADKINIQTIVRWAKNRKILDR